METYSLLETCMPPIKNVGAEWVGNIRPRPTKRTHLSTCVWLSANC
uniref:Uncharacterized protein n=1 Tax=Siphoviridae sp. ct8Cp41 TaxID=2825358 RepID=A0A8S5UBG5_9CAUD|nr:MAG TPA: hypothetical protein [Siphoviridae sp. ct8Cp41]